jgi:hypothetical protein
MQRGRTEKPPVEEADGAASARLAAAARVLLLLLVTMAALFAFFLSRPPGHSSASLHPRYVCPMHHQVRADAPGQCPICGMALEPLVEGPALAATGEATPHLPHGAVDVVRRRIFSHQVQAPAWVEADGTVGALLYEDDVATLAPGEQGLFTPAATPGASAVVRWVGTPAVPWDASTSKLTFRATARAPALAPGTTGWVELPPRARPTLVIPAAAVLQSADGPFVLALPARGTGFTRRPVRVGKMPYGLAMVLSGLEEDERIAVKTAFFLDAERRLTAGADSARP